jgi:hypothetical protein
MATSKAKRLIGLAQPKAQHRTITAKTNREARAGSKPEGTGLMPVKAHIYHSIAELNSGFEKVAQELQTLGGLNLFRSNRDFALVIHDREKVNAGLRE